MTLEDMIMNEIDKVPIQKQTEIERKYVDLYREKEYYRYETVKQEQKKDKWKRAYFKLDDRINKALEVISTYSKTLDIEFQNQMLEALKGKTKCDTKQ